MTRETRLEILLVAALILNVINVIVLLGGHS